MKATGIENITLYGDEPEFVKPLVDEVNQRFGQDAAYFVLDYIRQYKVEMESDLNDQKKYYESQVESLHKNIYDMAGQIWSIAGEIEGEIDGFDLSFKLDD